MPGWKRKGWKKGDGKPVANVEIMKALDEAMTGRRDRVRFEWVKGHAGHPLNEKADVLANAAARAFQEGREAVAGPGYAGAGRDPHAFSVTLPPEPDADLFSLAESLELSDEDQVVALERSLLTDEVRSDPATVAALLHADWEEVGRSGRRWTREEVLAAIGGLDGPGGARGAGRRPGGPRRAAAGVASGGRLGGVDAAQLAVGAVRGAVAAAVPPGNARGLIPVPGPVLPLAALLLWLSVAGGSKDP